MTLNEFGNEIKNWKLTRYKAINLVIALSAVLIYEFIGRPLYRPYIYKHGINDFHIADTLGNSLGTVATIFFLIGILSTEAAKGKYLIVLGTCSVVIFELAHPLLGKPIDSWDILATLVTGAICYLVYNLIFKTHGSDKKLKTDSFEGA